MEALDPLVVVTDPPPQIWSAIARALETAPSAHIVVTSDVRADPREADARARFDACGDRLIGPASGGAHQGGTRPIALASRVGAGFEAITRELDVREAIDLGLGWGLDEADLIARWVDAGLTTIVLIAPRPSGRLARAIRSVTGHVAVVVLDPLGRDWSPLGAATLTRTSALAHALTPIAGEAHGLDVVHLVGASRPALDLVRAALDAVGIAVRAPSPEAALAIADEVHVCARFDGVVDLTGLATPRHLALATEALAREGAVVVIDGAIAADAASFVEGVAARRLLATMTPHALVAAPPADVMRAHTLTAAALLMKQTTLGREEALAVAAAMGLGRPAPSLSVARVEAAAEVLRRLGGRPVLGAAGVEARPADELAAAWDAVTKALEPTDPFAARWIASVPAEATPFTLTLTRGPIGPQAEWRHGGREGAMHLPARVVDLDDCPLPAALVGAASALVMTLPDVAHLTLVGVIATDRTLLVDARAAIQPEDGA